MRPCSHFDHRGGDRWQRSSCISPLTVLSSFFFLITRLLLVIHGLRLLGWFCSGLFSRVPYFPGSVDLAGPPDSRCPLLQGFAKSGRQNPRKLSNCPRMAPVWNHPG